MHGPPEGLYGPIDPTTQFESRCSLVGLRLGKSIQVRHVRLQPRVDFYNLFNGTGIIGKAARFGPQFLPPTEIVQGRFVKFGVHADFERGGRNRRTMAAPEATTNGRIGRSGGWLRA